MSNTWTIFETERLLLQRLHWDLFPELASLLANPAVHRHFPGPLNESESREFMNRVLAREEQDGYTFWAVFKKDDSAFIGICGLLKQEIDGVTEVEVAYRFNDNYWGHGFAPEAAAGCVAHARNVLRVQSVISLIRPVNRQSIRVAEKNGFVCEKLTTFGGFPHWVYRKMLS